ncbi:glucose-1-phosphate adenylyltransferase [Anaerocolumna xylanovorans]|uniref:Glucose-1-phosphate adenylyltransferase n=1 Tax=Anaerocolumna xylanovorans DSM 12503 TaxID=1121345 RepID=A0A1M7YNU9_9FIRM|nr:glucose-1-phosphate adenylyltransferase [Anaerocolumna xylanovorans]SHO54228.1 glucose-1-phosphate adenylyltransferase [Anaerocolumna xylanovorans DSM 12503]
MQKECIAMLLAGGEGSRLGVLTKNRAKPAVYFGGKYRIIDFTLSNCVNSRIDTVGVLTQYQPHELNDYIGNGQSWDLDRANGGIHILPPYQRREASDWYTGTANAIAQNIPFIDRYKAEYVLILSGDHIYKMNYYRMLEYHKEKGADCTIAVIEVDIKEASRFGIMNTKEDNQIYEFEEKPKEPKSNKASMGIYIFCWDKLKHYLELDEKCDNSANDFGKNIIPAMLAAGEKMYAYPFYGYWKDVGTVESLWEAQMDLLNQKENILTSDMHWTIYANSPVRLPHYISSKAKVDNCIITEGCSISGNISSSVIFQGVTVEEGASVSNSIILPGAYIKKQAKIQNAIVDENTVIGEMSCIGEAAPENTEKSIPLTVIGRNVHIQDSEAVEGNMMVDVDHREVIS